MSGCAVILEQPGVRLASYRSPSSSGHATYIQWRCGVRLGHNNLLAVVVVERGETIRVVTAYELDAGQKKEYLARRLRGE